MFHGSLPPTVQAMIYETVKKWGCKDVWVACSGNFTIERTLYQLGVNLYSNDVTIYSVALGEYFAGREIPVQYNEGNPYEDRIGWIKEYMGTEEDKLATIMLATNLMQSLGAPNAYYERMLNAYRNQWKTLHEKTKERILKNETRVKEFYAMDAMDFVDLAPKEHGIIAYPPFFAGDYEKMFSRLEEVFLWAPPSYELFTEESRDKLFEKMMGHKNFMFGTNKKIDGLDEYLRGMSKTTNRGTPLFVYSNSDKTRLCIPNQPTSPVLLERLKPGDEIGDDIRLVTLDAQQFSSLRSQYMNINIIPGQATIALGVVVDDKLIGVYAFSAAPSFADWDKYIETPTMYMLSDFPVAPTDYDRLAKLVIYAALSKESKLIAEQVSNRRVRSLITTAFAKNPVSMKYRGILKLLNKKEQKGKADGSPSDQYYGQKYVLNYGGPMGEWTLQEGLALWKKKHGKVKNTGKAEE